jgi:hypothetical protein
MATQKWTAPPAAVTALTTAELNALANDAMVAGAFVKANGVDLDQSAHFEFVGTIASAPVADRTLDLYAQYQFDGANYEDFTAARPSAQGALGSFVLDNTTGTQRKYIMGAVLLPFPFRLVLINKSGFALGATNTVKMWTHNQQVTT